jgi:hypothetical protein
MPLIFSVLLCLTSSIVSRNATQRATPPSGTTRPAVFGSETSNPSNADHFVLKSGDNEIGGTTLAYQNCLEELEEGTNTDNSDSEYLLSDSKRNGATKAGRRHSATKDQQEMTRSVQRKVVICLFAGCHVMNVFRLLTNICVSLGTSMIRRKRIL